MTVKHRLPTQADLDSLPHFYLTGKEQWDPSRFYENDDDYSTVEPLLTNQVLAQHVIDDTEDLEDRGGTDSQSISTSNDLASQVFSLPFLLPPQDDDSSCDSSLSTLNPI